MDAVKRTRPFQGGIPCLLAWGIVSTIGCGTGAVDQQTVDAHAIDRQTVGLSPGEDPLPPVKITAAARRSRKQDITFDDLEFPIDRDSPFDPALLTDEIRALEGQPVVLRGFILAASVYQQKGIKQFVLVRDNQECCFGPGAYLYHNCQVECVPGRSTGFTIRPVTVHGTLRLKPLIGPDGKCLSVYHITATRIK